MMGGLFTAFDVVVNGLPMKAAPRVALYNMGGLYVYNILQCPMEAIHGRQSSLHNVMAGGLIGYIGVQSGRLGIPFVDAYFFYRYPGLSPPMMAFAVYGGIGGALATMGGKNI